MTTAQWRSRELIAQCHPQSLVPHLVKGRVEEEGERTTSWFKTELTKYVAWLFYVSEYTMYVCTYVYPFEQLNTYSKCVYTILSLQTVQLSTFSPTQIRMYIQTNIRTYERTRGNCIILLVLRINQVTTKPAYNASWWLSKPLVCGGTTWVLLACQCDNHFWSGIKGVPLPGGKEHEGPPRLPPARCLSPLPCDLSYSVALNWVWGQGQPSHDTVEVI